jgi:hypothetical protein
MPPDRATRSYVDKLYTEPGSTAPQCLFTRQPLYHGSSDSTFQYCHWIPKNLETKVSISGLQLDNNAANFFPTIKLIEQNVELHQRAPNLSLKFQSAHNDTFDRYQVQISPHVPLSHILRQVTHGVSNASNQLVLVPTISRPFVELHFRVFCEHHGIKNDGWIITPTSFPTFDKLVAEALFSLIMLNSPLVADAKKGTRKPKAAWTFQAPEIKVTNPIYPARQLTMKQAKELVHTTIRLSSKMFPGWNEPEHFMNVYVVRHDSKKRAFEFAFPDDTEPSVFLRFKEESEYTGKTAMGLGVQVYEGQKESNIVTFGDPDFVKGLELEFVRDRKKQKPPKSPRARAQSPAGLATSFEVTGASTTCNPGVALISSQIRAAVDEVPAGFRASGKILILLSTGWKNGTIFNLETGTIKVNYDNGERRSHKFDEIIEYKLIAEALVHQEASHENEWLCVQCQIWHSILQGPKDKVCCSNCKRTVRTIGMLFSEQRHIRQRNRSAHLHPTESVPAWRNRLLYNESVVA